MIPGWSSLVVVMLFIGGVQVFVMGVIGEYLGRAYTEVKGRPLYVLRGKVGFDVVEHQNAIHHEDAETTRELC